MVDMLSKGICQVLQRYLAEESQLQTKLSELSNASFS